MAKKSASRSGARSRVVHHHHHTTVVNAMEPTTTGSSGGIRSLPSFNTWDNRNRQTPARRRDRVRISRFVREKLPFCGYINTGLAEEAVGDGMSVTSISKNRDFRTRATAYFDLWGSSPAIDIRKRLNIYTCQAPLTDTMLGDGEFFALKVRDSRREALQWKLEDKSKRRLQLQFFSTDQIGQGTLSLGGTPVGWEDGIQLSELDKAITYRVLKKGATGQASGFVDRPAEQMIHVFLDSWLNQVRGTPAMFRGEDSALDALDLRNLEKFANKIRATFLGAVTTPTGAPPKSMKNQIRAGQKKNDAGEDVDNGLRYYEIAGGVQLPIFSQGESITFFTGQQGMSFAEFGGTLMQEMAYAYMLPPEYVCKLIGIGSAVARTVLRKVAKCHQRVRRPLREQFLQQVWEFVIGDAIEIGALPLVPDWNQIRCKGGNDLSIDAGRDEKAEQERLRTFTGTIDMYADSLGLDGERIRHERLLEIADNIAFGKTIGLPWFLCVDPQAIQAITGLATAMGVDVAELVKEIGRISEE